MKRILALLALAVIAALGGVEGVRAQTAPIYNLQTIDLTRSTQSAERTWMSVRFTATVQRTTSARTWYVGMVPSRSATWSKSAAGISGLYYFSANNRFAPLGFTTRPIADAAAVGDVINANQYGSDSFESRIADPADRACEVTAVNGNLVSYSCYLSAARLGVNFRTDRGAVVDQRAIYRIRTNTSSSNHTFNTASIPAVRETQQWQLTGRNNGRGTFSNTGDYVVERVAIGLERSEILVSASGGGLSASWSSRTFANTASDQAYGPDESSTLTNEPTSFICGALDVANRIHSSVSTIGNTCQVTGLIESEPYRFYWEGFNASNDRVVGYLSDETMSSLSVVDGLRVIPGNQSIAVTWNQVTGATRYLVSAVGGGSNLSCTLNAVSTPVGGYTCSVGGATNGTSYAVTVRAYNAAGTLIATSSVRRATPSASPTYPDIPNLAVTPGDSRAAVSWGTVEGATSYAVVARFSADPPAASRASVTQLHSPALLTGLQNGQTYLVTVTASGAGGVLARGRILLQPTAERVSIENLSALPRSGALFVSWDSAVDAVRYTATAQPPSGAAATCEASAATAADSPHCLISGLTNGTAYSVSVTAYDAGGTAIAVSRTLSATPTTAPAPHLPLIRGMTVTAASRTLTVDWEGVVGGATGYTVTAALPSTPNTIVATDTGLNPPLRLRGLTNGVTYLVVATANDAAGGALARATGYGQPTAAAAPEMLGVRVIPRDGGVFASWPRVADAARYTALADSTICAVTTAGGPHCSASGLTNGTQYTLTIHAFDGAAQLVGQFVTTFTPTADAVPLPAIEDAQITPADRALTVLWGDEVLGAAGYQAVARTLVGDAATGTSPSALHPPLEIGGLLNGQTYNVTLTAYATDTGGVLSDPIAQSVLRGQPSAASAPRLTGIRTVARTGAVFISWNALDEAARYTAELSPEGSGACEVDVATVAGGSWCVISGLTDGDTYTLTLIAYDNSGGEIASNGVVSFTLAPSATPLPPIGGAEVSPGNANVSVSWTEAVAGADEYRLAASLNGVAASATGSLVGLNPPLHARGLRNGQTYTLTLTAYQGGFAIARSTLFGRPTVADEPASPGAIVPTPIPIPASPAARLDPDDPLPDAPDGIMPGAPGSSIPGTISGDKGITAAIRPTSLIERLVTLFPMSTSEISDDGLLGDPPNLAWLSARPAQGFDSLMFPGAADREALTLARTGATFDGEVRTGRRIVFQAFEDVNEQAFHILSPTPFDTLQFDFDSRAPIPSAVDVIWEYSSGHPAQDDWRQFDPESAPFRSEAADARMALGLDVDQWRLFQPIHPDGEVMSAMDVPPDRPHWAVRITLRGEVSGVLLEAVIADVFVAVDQWGYLPFPANSTAAQELEISENRPSRWPPSHSVQQMGIRLDDVPQVSTIRIKGVRFATHGREVYTANMEEWSDPDRFAWDNSTRSYYDGSIASRPGAWSVDFYEVPADARAGRSRTSYEFRAGNWTRRTNLNGRYNYSKTDDTDAGDAPIAVGACADAPACLRSSGAGGYQMSSTTLADSTPQTAFVLTYNLPPPAWVREEGDDKFALNMAYVCSLDQNSGNQRIVFSPSIGGVAAAPFAASPTDCGGVNTQRQFEFDFPAGYRSGLGFSDQQPITMRVLMTSDNGAHDPPTLRLFRMQNQEVEHIRNTVNLPTRYTDGDPSLKYDFEFEAVATTNNQGVSLNVKLPGDTTATALRFNNPFPNSLSADPSRWPPLYLLMHEGGQIIGFDSIEIIANGVTAVYDPAERTPPLGVVEFVDSEGNIVYTGEGGPFVALAHDGELPNWRFAAGDAVRIVNAAEEAAEVAGPAPDLVDDMTLNTQDVFGNNYLASALSGTGVSLRAMWIFILLGGAVGLAIVGYVMTSSPLLAAALAMLPIAAGVPMGVVPFWAALVYALFVAGGVVLKGRIAPSL